MGRPIAGEDQFPYTIGGFLVDGAKINGELYNKELFIHKQRSSDVYDLVDANGKVFQFIRLVHRNQSGNIMNFYQIGSVLTRQLPDNTFYMKVQDPQNAIYGFATIWQWWKVKVHTGQYIYRTSHIDPHLSGVSMSPTFMSVEVGQTGTTRVSFIPYDYHKKTGKWFVSNANITAEMVEDLLPPDYDIGDFMSILQSESKAYGKDKNFSPLEGEEQIHAPGAPTPDGLGFQFTGVTEGFSIIRFVPDNNDSLTAMCIVQVLESTAFESVELISDSIYPSAVVRPFFHEEEEFELKLLFTPEDFVPSRGWTPAYNEDYYEYLGTDDNINYKFKTKPGFAASTISLSSVSSSGIQSVNIAIGKASIYPTVTMTTKRAGMNVGETYAIEVVPMTPDSTPRNDSVITFESSNPAIATISGNTVTAVSPGNVSIRAICDNLLSDTYVCSVGTGYPEKIDITPTFRRAFIVGNFQYLGLEVTPSTYPTPAGTFEEPSSGTYVKIYQPDQMYFPRALTPPLLTYANMCKVVFRPSTPIYPTASSSREIARCFYGVQSFSVPSANDFWYVIDLPHVIKQGSIFNTSAVEMLIMGYQLSELFEIDSLDTSIVDIRDWTVDTPEPNTSSKNFTVVAKAAGSTTIKIKYIPTGEVRSYPIRVY